VFTRQYLGNHAGNRPCVEVCITLTQGSGKISCFTRFECGAEYRAENTCMECGCVNSTPRICRYAFVALLPWTSRSCAETKRRFVWGAIRQVLRKICMLLKSCLAEVVRLAFGLEVSLDQKHNHHHDRRLSESATSLV
jgi:hypothetical protein